MNIETETN